ncbi:MAG: hypothetical protein KH137_04425 [Streptococcus parasanguinis]|nr:hypothetical protein [Streptococcus parasanguinis]
MTKYYSNKPDFSSDTPWVLFLNATAKMKDFLEDIEALGKKVQEEEVEDLYVQRGEAALGVTKESGPFKTSYDRVNTMFTSAKKIHPDIMQNIDSKFTKGMDDAFVTLEKVNGHANPYKSKYIKKDVIKSRQVPGPNGYVKEAYTDQESYKLYELLDGKVSPISAAKEVYDERLGVAKQILANKDKLSAEQRKVIEGKTAEEIVEIQYPTELPSYQRLKGSTFQEENKNWLQYIDLGLQVTAIAASVVGTVSTGGMGTPLLAASMSYVAVNSGYAMTTGKTLITGTQLTSEEKFWSGVEFFATLISGGGIVKLAKLGEGGTTLVRGIAKAATHADDMADATQTFYAVATDKNPEEAIFSYVGKQVLRFGVGKFVDHLNVKRINAELDTSYQDYSSRKLNAGETSLTKSEWQKKVETLEKNKASSADFKATQTEEFNKIATNVEKRITIATNMDGEIKKVRVDAIGVDSNGKIRIQDYTTSSNIPSKRQAILDNISQNGGVIVGKGKGEFVGGVEIPKGTRIEIISQKTSDISIEHVSPEIKKATFAKFDELASWESSWNTAEKQASFKDTFDMYAERAVKEGAVPNKETFYKMYEARQYDYPDVYKEAIKQPYLEKGASSVVSGDNVKNFAFNNGKTVGRMDGGVGRGNFTTSIVEDSTLLYDKSGNLKSGSEIATVKGVRNDTYDSGMFQYEYSPELVKNMDKEGLIQFPNGDTPGSSSLNIPGAKTWAGSDIKMSESELLMPTIDMQEHSYDDFLYAIKKQGYYEIKNPTVVVPGENTTIDIEGIFRINQWSK